MSRKLFPEISLCSGGSLFSIIEGTQECLGRLQLTYVDVIFAHRCDITGTKVLSIAWTVG